MVVLLAETDLISDFRCWTYHLHVHFNKAFFSQWERSSYFKNWMMQQLKYRTEHILMWYVNPSKCVSVATMCISGYNVYQWLQCVSVATMCLDSGRYACGSDIWASERHRRYLDRVRGINPNALNRSRLTRQTHLCERQMSKTNSAHYSKIIAEHSSDHQPLWKAFDKILHHC